MSIQTPSRQPASLKKDLSSPIQPMDADKEIPIVSPSILGFRREMLNVMDDRTPSTAIP